MLLISSSILSSCQVHVQFLPFTVGVLPKLYHSYSFLSRFNQSGFNSFLSIKLLICVFATSKVHMVPLVSILYRSALNCFQFCCLLSFNFSTSQGSLVSLLGRRSNLVLPLIFLFLFPPVPSQISGRDPLVVVECCDAPRPELQMPSRVSGFRCVFCLVHCIHHCIMCIASCHHAIMSFIFLKLN